MLPLYQNNYCTSLYCSQVTETPSISRKRSTELQVSVWAIINVSHEGWRLEALINLVYSRVSIDWTHIPFMSPSINGDMCHHLASVILCNIATTLSPKNKDINLNPSADAQDGRAVKRPGLLQSFLTETSPPQSQCMTKCFLFYEVSFIPASTNVLLFCLNS